MTDKPTELCGQCNRKTLLKIMQVCLKCELLFCSDGCHHLYHLNRDE